MSQVSRVTVIGSHGADKTAGLHMLHVVQHAFHHLKMHMQETPTVYFEWRFAGNDKYDILNMNTSTVGIVSIKAVEAIKRTCPCYSFSGCLSSVRYHSVERDLVEDEHLGGSITFSGSGATESSIS